MRNRAALRLLLVAIVPLASLLAMGCSLPGQTYSGAPGNGVLGWPFDTTQGHWTIENGYNTDPDHHNYELDSFDVQQAGGTTGQPVLSPATGTSVGFGSAYPGDGSSGACVSITIDGQSGYHVMVCHLDHPITGKVNRGDQIGTVSGGTHGDHIHITLYYLEPSVADTSANASQRQALAFNNPWTLAGCDYPASGAADEWAGIAVPCDGTGSGGTVQPTPTPPPTVSGSWQMTLTFHNSPQQCMLELQQDGNAVTGTITCQDGQVSVNGSISGNQISLEGSERVSDSQIFDYSFTGSLNDMFSAMSGNAVVTDLSGINTPLEGTWSATRSN